jgi:TonB family protein
MTSRLAPFIVSLLFHSIVLVAFVFIGKSEDRHDEQEIVLEVISDTSVLGLTRRTPPKTQKIKKFVKSDILDLPVPNQEISIGESEIGADLVGRMPRDVQEKYLVSLRNQVRLQQKYPKQSLVFKEEGLVKVRVTLDRKGALTKLELIQESRFPRLNDAAMKAVSDAAPFPEFPTEIEFQAWKVTVPIQFMLSRN